jgi:hypothetical protein
VLLQRRLAGLHARRKSINQSMPCGRRLKAVITPAIMALELPAVRN